MSPEPAGSVRVPRKARGGGVFVPRYEVAPSGRRVASPAASFPGRRLVQAAAVVDLAFAAAVLAQTFFGHSPWGRFIARFLVGVGAWMVLAQQTGAMKPRALQLRRAFGAMGVAFVLVHRLAA